MEKDKIIFKPIGIIHTPFPEPVGVPIQSIAGKGIEGTIEVFPEYEEALSDTEGFSYLHILFYLDRAWKTDLRVIPFMDDVYRGVFATRSPNRPNPIGLSIVELVKREGNILHIRDLDIVDGTPLLDIKPYIPASDIRETDRIGWLKENIQKLPDKEDDGRFAK